MPKTIKGFKAFKKGLICKDIKFEEGKTYETDKAKICQSGFHLCRNPLDVLDYYDLCESEFAEAEALGKIDTHKEDSKIATTKIKIGMKLSLKAFIEASVNFLLTTCKSKKTAASEHSSKLAASGYSSQLAASGYSSKLAASGYSSQLAASGDSSKLAASGDSSQLAASGDFSKLAASGYSSQLAASGDSSQLAASGDSSQLAASGYSSQLAASGDFSKLAASGYSSKLAASGYSSQLAASGYSSKLAASGYSSQLAASGDSSQLAASGDSSQLELSGENCVGAGIGINNKIKGKKGNWITLAEWIYDDNKKRYIPICVKSAQIDNISVFEDKWYQLKNGEFIEV